MKATLSLLFADFPALPMANVGNTELAAKAPAAVDKKFLRFISVRYQIFDELGCPTPLAHVAECGNNRINSLGLY